MWKSPLRKNLIVETVGGTKLRVLKPLKKLDPTGYFVELLVIDPGETKLEVGKVVHWFHTEPGKFVATEIKSIGGHTVLTLANEFWTRQDEENGHIS